MSEFNKWEEIVIKAILLQKKFNITEVNDFKSIRSLLFKQEKYLSVVSLIKDNDWDSLTNITDEDEGDFREYLDIIKFSDQNKQICVATVYDNNELHQDPQIIDIFILT